MPQWDYTGSMSDDALRKGQYLRSNKSSNFDPNVTTKGVGGSEVQRYNDAVNQLKDFYGNTDIGNSLGYTSSFTTIPGGLNGAYAQQFHYINPNSASSALNEYAKEGGYMDQGKTWSDFAKQKSGQFVDNYNTVGKNLYDTASKSVLDDYNTAALKNYVSQNDTNQYAEAKSQLDKQLARGYLSDVGYATALQKLNNQSAANRSNLSSLAKNQYNTWSDDMAQAWQKNILDNDALSDGNSWLKYYDDYMNGGNQQIGNMFTKAQDAVKDYANMFVSPDLMNAALSPYSMYNPDEYIAYGAANQGEYNPFQYNKRKRKTSFENIGEV